MGLSIALKMASNSPNKSPSRTSNKTAGGAQDVEAVPTDGDETSLCDIHDVPVPPDGGWGWIIVLSSFICNFIVDGICYTFGVFLDSYVIYFDSGKGTVSWAGSLLAGVYLSCGPIVSALTNRFGCRATCIVGSIFGALSFVASTYSNSVTMLLITYGVCGGIGFGLIYLPAIVSVGYYFEKRRALATGIAVCGSGFGSFVFAPVASAMLNTFDWRGANLILAALILNCMVFGALTRPLPLPKKRKPLLQRMAEDKAMQLEQGSLMGSSYFMVRLPDGSYKKRLKVPVNVDPGVHSNLNIDNIEMTSQQAPTLATITEMKPSELAIVDSDVTSDSAVPKEEKDIKNSQLKENLDDHEAQESDKLIQEKRSCCTCVPDSVKNLLDFSLMKDPVFLLLGLGNVFGMLGFYVPYIYIIDAAKIKGISDTDAPFLISIIGIINTVGRLVVGWLSDFPFVDSLFVTNVCILVSGATVFAVPLCVDYIGFCAVAAVFGLFSSAYIALTSIVLVDLLGIAQLTNAFGLLCFLRGIAAIAGPPIAGSIYDYTQSYDVSFHLGGIFLFASAIIGFLVPSVRRLTMRLRKQAKETSNLSEMKEMKSGEEMAKGSSKPVKV